APGCWPWYESWPCSEAYGLVVSCAVLAGPYSPGSYPVPAGLYSPGSYPVPGTWPGTSASESAEDAPEGPSCSGAVCCAGPHWEPSHQRVAPSFSGSGYQPAGGIEVMSSLSLASTSRTGRRRGRPQPAIRRQE